MINGYFALGGGSYSQLPLFKGIYTGNHVGARDKGNWVMDTELPPDLLSIPARDKQVQLFASVGESKFNTSMASIDSSFDQHNYRTKLSLILRDLPSDFMGAVNNINTSTHGSLAVLTNTTPLYIYGLHDTQFGGSYLLWSPDPAFVTGVLAASPLRYLIYRFPVLAENALFLPGESICSKWWRWLKHHKSTLYAFNALERRLFYGSAETL